MKLKKIAAAAVAMAMAVSMLSVPVFAADTAPTGGANTETANTGDGVYTSTETSNFSSYEGKSSGTASTDVNVIYSTDASQLSVTVPIRITVAVKGDKTLLTPQTYGITNESVMPVHVTSIKVTADGEYQLSGNTAPSGKQIKLGMKTSNTDATTTYLTTSTSDTSGTNQTFTSKDWNIAAKSSTDNTKLGITFEGGQVGDVDANWAAAQNAAGVKLFTITYTIAAGTAN